MPRRSPAAAARVRWLNRVSNAWTSVFRGFGAVRTASKSCPESFETNPKVSDNEIETTENRQPEARKTVVEVMNIASRCYPEWEWNSGFGR